MMDRSYPIISERPSNTVASSSSEARPSLRPIRSTESVRIWLIFTHDRLGRLAAMSSRVSGNPARGSWLVSATAITVPERSLKTLLLRIRTGRCPACSDPRTGFRSAQRTSPLSIRATSHLLQPVLRQPSAVLAWGQAWRTPEQAWFLRAVLASPLVPLR